MFIDTHAHVFNEYYDDINLIMLNAKNNNVGYVINSGIDNKTNHEILQTSLSYDNMYVTLGIHPESVDTYKETDLDFIKQNLDNPKVVAIGEIGLDYHYDNYDKERQIKLLKAQLEIAQKYNYPVVIHSREATLDTINILKEYSVKGIIHSFSGSKEVAQEYIKMGYKLGINGVVSFKNAHIKETIKDIGIEHFVLETDSPYLTPMPFRGTQNSPQYIKNIVDYLSEYLEISSTQIAEITNKNVTSIFDKITL